MWTDARSAPADAGATASRARTWSWHAAAAALFVALPVALTWPLAVQLHTHVPGAGADDNLVFLWNFWWMRQAISTGVSPFHTGAVFLPGGVDLVLHTHNALNSIPGATLLRGLSLPAALGLTVLATCALNGFSAYLLAWRATGTVPDRTSTTGASRGARWGAAVLAGIFFAASPAMSKHLAGHFNLYTAWPLVLFACAFLEALERRSRAWAALAGVMAALVAYADYYYVVYACALAATVLGWRALQPSLRVLSYRRQHGGDRVLLGIAAGAALLAIAIAVTGGFVVNTGIFQISMRTGTNLRAMGTAVMLWWLWRRWRPRVHLSPWAPQAAADLRLLPVIGIVAALLMSPIAVAAIGLWRSGGYVSQTYLWRSAPAGVDLGTLVAGNPFNTFWGAPVSRLYDALGMYAFDGPLWLGIAPIVLLVTRPWKTLPVARLWLVVAGIFILWALGPYLVVLGVNTGLPMPQTLLRFIPIAANARIPSHAAAAVCLAVAVLLACAAASFRRPRRSIAILAGVLLLDFWPAPIPMRRLEVPALYSTLARLPPGGVLELPMGIRDGFGEEGRFDPYVLYYQTVHERPIAGGYIARLSPVVKARYHQQPVLDALLHLSAGEPVHDRTDLPSADEISNFMDASGIRYIVINRAAAPSAVQDFVRRLPLRPIEDDGQRVLYGR